MEHLELEPGKLENLAESFAKACKIGDYTIAAKGDKISIKGVMMPTRTGPMAPAQTDSQRRRCSSVAWPWLPIWVATFFSRAAWATCRASQTEWVSGFSQ